MIPLSSSTGHHAKFPSAKHHGDVAWQERVDPLFATPATAKTSTLALATPDVRFAVINTTTGIQ
jgi:hypothetical protein